MTRIELGDDTLRVEQGSKIFTVLGLFLLGLALLNVTAAVLLGSKLPVGVAAELVVGGFCIARPFRKVLVATKGYSIQLERRTLLGRSIKTLPRPSAVSLALGKSSGWLKLEFAAAAPVEILWSNKRWTFDLDLDGLREIAEETSTFLGLPLAVREPPP